MGSEKQHVRIYGIVGNLWMLWWNASISLAAN
jgi:hypothetical protein